MTFDDFWDSGIDDTCNPYRKDSAAHWAWLGWQAGMKAMRDREAESEIVHLERRIAALKAGLTPNVAIKPPVLRSA